MIWSCADCGALAAYVLVAPEVCPLCEHEQRLRGESALRDAHDALQARWERREAKLRELLSQWEERAGEIAVAVD